MSYDRDICRWSSTNSSLRSYSIATSTVVVYASRHQRSTDINGRWSSTTSLRLYSIATSTVGGARCSTTVDRCRWSSNNSSLRSYSIATSTVGGAAPTAVYGRTHRDQLVGAAPTTVCRDRDINGVEQTVRSS